MVYPGMTMLIGRFTGISAASWQAAAGRSNELAWPNSARIRLATQSEGCRGFYLARSRGPWSWQHRCRFVPLVRDQHGDSVTQRRLELVDHCA